VTSATESRSRWLFSAPSDLLLGCGGAYAVIFLLMCVGGDWVRALAPYGLLPLLILFTGIPHYGATLLRVYRKREDRRTYRFFAVWLTLAVYAWFVVGIYDVAVGSWLLTLYVTWSPWHYTGQNYGISLMFLHRRGVSVTDDAKRWIYGSFVLSFVIAFVGSHTATGDAVYVPVTLVEGSYELMKLDIPASIGNVLLVVAGIAYLVANFVAFAMLRRKGSWRDLAPTLALAATQALWFAAPVVSRSTGLLEGLLPFDRDLSGYTFLWIAIGHSIQYLWVTTYYAVTADRKEQRSHFLLWTLLAGAAIWGVPSILFGPDLLGTRALDAGLALLVASAVNIHHFILDGAIWKLRDGRVARVLLQRQRSVDDEPIGDAATIPWLGPAVRGVVATAGVVYVVFTVVGTIELEFGVRRAMTPPDFERLETAARRLHWVARDQPDVHYNLGMHAFRQGDYTTARRELRRSLALANSSITWVALGFVEKRDRQLDDALAAFEAALALAPDNVQALIGSARVWVQLGEPERARSALTRAIELEPHLPGLQEQLDELPQ